MALANQNCVMVVVMRDQYATYENNNISLAVHNVDLRDDNQQYYINVSKRAPIGELFLKTFTAKKTIEEYVICLCCYIFVG